MIATEEGVPAGTAGAERTGTAPSPGAGRPPLSTTPGGGRIRSNCHGVPAAELELDPEFRKLWEDGAKDELSRAEAWLRAAAPAISASLTVPAA